MVRCTKEEAALIREAAKREHRTISGYILHTVMGRIEQQLEEQWRKTHLRMAPPPQID
jgi:uncharacterized protein (DUF1778 family)